MDDTASVLTPKQREYLNNKEEDESADAAERAMKSRIRDRIAAGLMDLSLIFQRFPLDDIETATTDPEDSIALPITNTLPDVAGLLYLASRSPGERDLDEMDIEWITEVGCQRALNRLGIAWEDVDADVVLEKGEALDELAGGELAELSRDRLRQLLFTGKITDEQFSEAIDAKPEEN